MNRQSLKNLILLIAISFILQIALLGYAFAYDTSGMTEQRSEDHDLSGNYEGYYGGDYYNATMYYPADFKEDYYDSGDSGGYADEWSDYEYDYGNQGGSDDYDWTVNDYNSIWADIVGVEYYEYDSGNYGGDDYGYDDPRGDTWNDSYDSVGWMPGATYDSTPDEFSPPIDYKWEFIMGLAGEETPGTGLGIDVDYLGDGPNIRQLVQDALPEIRGMGGNS